MADHQADDLVERMDVNEIIEEMTAWKSYLMENDGYLVDLLIQDSAVMARAILNSGDLFLIDEVLKKISGKGLEMRCREDQ